MSDLNLRLPPPGRVNATLLHDLHPENHNVVVDAINALYDGVVGFDATIHLEHYIDLATLYADGSQPPGTIGFASYENTLAIWDPATIGWVIIVEPMHVFTPRLWFGSTEMPLVTHAADGNPLHDYVSKVAQRFGYCWFRVHARFGGLDTVTSGVLAVMPPIAPRAVAGGPLTMGYVITPGHFSTCLNPVIGVNEQTIGGAYDGTTLLSGATVPGRFALIQNAGDGRETFTPGLIDRGDLGELCGDTLPNAHGDEFDINFAGSYPILGFPAGPPL